MKKLSLLTLAAAGMLTLACSEKDAVVENPAQEVEDFKDGAYLGLSLSLPSADKAFTRANDSLSNGTDDEFRVKNATLYIFKAGTSEEDPDKNAKFVTYVTLGTTYTQDDQPGINPDEWGLPNPRIDTRITSTYNEAALIPNDVASAMKTDTENKYYAYVIVNHNGQVPAVEKDVTTFETFSKTPFSEIGADIAAKANIKEGGLLMTNAPICDKPGGSAAPAEGAKYTTLVELDNTKIYGNKQLAEESPAGCVYIERAAVKVTVEDGREENDKKIGTYDVSILGWQVINYEPTYYNTRQIESAWGPYYNESANIASTKYRFVSVLPFVPTQPNTTGHTTGYRTYFAKDVQYNTDATLSKTQAIDNDANWITVSSTNHAYTTENTFDVAHQTWKNTTMVTLKVQIGTPENNFYTVGKGSQTMLENADKAGEAIGNVIKNDPAVTVKYNALLDKISSNNPGETVTAGLNVNLDEVSAGKTDVPFTIVLAYLIGNKTAEYDGDGESELKAQLEAAINNVIYVDPAATTKVTADAVQVSYYKGGISFYNARIKHFGDAETPWSATGSYISGGGANVNEIYGIGQNPDKSTERFLGRYGVVRDNWYKLSIDKIGKIGSAEPVDPSKTTPDTPDDEIENFISVHVHIVPWVLRTQSVQF